MKEETTIQVISGLETIGGNILCIQKGNYTLLTDFGTLDSSQEALFNKGQTSTLIEEGQLPDIPALYTGQPDQKFIVCISHLHLDHVGSLFHVFEDIPIYASQEAVAFYHALVEAGQLPDYQVNWQGVETGVSFREGPFEITFHASDHDTPGVCSLFIRTEDLSLIHSGDFRLSGFQPKKVLDWALAAREFQADIYFSEGTSFSRFGEEADPIDIALAEWMTPLRASDEYTWLEEVDQLLEAQPDRLFAYNGYPQNIERQQAFITLLEAHGRQAVYFEPLAALIAPYKQVLTLGKEIALEDLQEQPEKYCLFVDEDTYPTLFELPAGVLLHANGVPLGSFMPGYETYVRELVKHDWQFIQAGVSGHASPRDLVTVAYLVGAKQTVPWHTFKPQAFGEALERMGLRVWYPTAGVSYTASESKQFQEGVFDE